MEAPLDGQPRLEYQVNFSQSRHLLRVDSLLRVEWQHQLGAIRHRRQLVGHHRQRCQPYNSWQWEGPFAMTVASKGIHTLGITRRESSTLVDRIFIGTSSTARPAAAADAGSRALPRAPAPAPDPAPHPLQIRHLRLLQIPHLLLLLLRIQRLPRIRHRLRARLRRQLRIPPRRPYPARQAKLSWSIPTTRANGSPLAPERTCRLRDLRPQRIVRREHGAQDQRPARLELYGERHEPPTSIIFR